MWIVIVILALIQIAVVVWMVWSVRKPSNLRDLVLQALGQSTPQVLEQAKQVLQSEKDSLIANTTKFSEAMQATIGELRRELAERQKEIRSLEQDRNSKFSQLSEALTQQRQLTKDLSTTTQHLTQILSNNQVRGQWGERIIEELLTNQGLVESVHYLRQRPLPDSTVRPDITLLLPNDRMVCVDVKFPFASIQKMSLADSKPAKEAAKKAFVQDVRAKLLEIDSRGYINPDIGTLDFAILFVPNELLFSYINQDFPELIDEALAKKILLVSPFTFIIVGRTIMESYRNFMMEHNLRLIVAQIGEFMNEWDRFALEFGKFDDAIDKLRGQYDKITTTRYRQMQQKINKIKEYQQSQLPLETTRGRQIPGPDSKSA